MKFYSEKTKDFYPTLEAIEKAEAKYDEDNKAYLEKRAVVDEKYKAYEEACKACDTAKAELNEAIKEAARAKGFEIKAFRSKSFSPHSINAVFQMLEDVPFSIPGILP